MSGQIKVGDLVMVVKPTLCCGDYRTVGRLFTVDNFYEGQLGRCPLCGHKQGHGVIARKYGSYNGFFLTRLKRIPPLEELEGEKRDEEIKA